MKKVLLFALVLFSVGMFAQMPNGSGLTCEDSKNFNYGEDLFLSSPFYVNCTYSQFVDSGVTAFWYSEGSLTLEVRTAPTRSGCSVEPLASREVGARENIMINASSMGDKFNEAIAKLNLDEDMLKGQYLVIGFIPSAEGRLIFNKFGDGVETTCLSPFDVMVNASYPLVPDTNVFRINPEEFNKYRKDGFTADDLPKLLFAYQPLEPTASTDFTAMKFEVLAGACDGDVMQSGEPVKGLGFGLFYLDPEILYMAVDAEFPLYIYAIHKNADPAVLAFSTFDSVTVRRTDSICNRNGAVEEYVETDEQVVNTTGFHFQHVITHVVLKDCPDTLTVAEVAALADALEPRGVSEQSYIFSGFVTDFVEYSAKYGNATFWIDDAAEGGKLFEVFQAKPVVAKDTLVKKGDEVLIKGQLKKYEKNGEYTLETAAGATYHILNPATSLQMISAKEFVSIVDGKIVVRARGLVQIYNVAGQMLYNSQSKGELVVEGIKQGQILIVRINDKVAKVAF